MRRQHNELLITIILNIYDVKTESERNINNGLLWFYSFNPNRAWFVGIGTWKTMSIKSFIWWICIVFVNMIKSRIFKSPSPSARNGRVLTTFTIYLYLYLVIIWWYLWIYEYINILIFTSIFESQLLLISPSFSVGWNYNCKSIF